jgi:hypothetical protein
MKLATGLTFLVVSSTAQPDLKFLFVIIADSESGPEKSQRIVGTGAKLRPFVSLSYVGLSYINNYTSYLLYSKRLYCNNKLECLRLLATPTVWLKNKSNYEFGKVII